MAKWQHPFVWLKQGGRIPWTLDHGSIWEKKTFDFSWYNPTYTRPVWLLNRAGSRDRKRHGTLIHCSLPITKCKSHNYGSCQLIIVCYASLLTYRDLLEKKRGGISSPMDSPSSQKSSPSAFLLSPRATIRPIGFLRLQQKWKSHLYSLLWN